jgi:predicted MPP superfamily phosphohydrolase
MKRREFLKLGAVLTAVSFGGVAYAKESSAIEVNTRSLPVPGLSEDIKIVSISDIHAPSYFRHTRYQDLVNTVNDQDPDVFILAGDIIDETGGEEIASRFSLFKAKVAKLAILGNWEYKAFLDLKRLRNEYQKAGVDLLVNDKIAVRGLVILGLDDFLHGSPDFRLVSDEGSTIPSLVMSHCPESFDYLSSDIKNPFVFISGHTHGGQIAPLGVVLHTPPGCGPYEKGWYFRGKHCMYVMRGVGTSGIPVRIGSRPEVFVLNLQGAKSIA